MFNIGFGEMVIIGIIALIVIGPKELPKMARTIGRMMTEFKRATGDISSQFLELKDSAQKEFFAQRDEIKKVMDLESLARSANQSKDEFVAQLKRELDTLEKTKESHQSVKDSLSGSQAHNFNNEKQHEASHSSVDNSDIGHTNIGHTNIGHTHPLARDDFEMFTSQSDEQPSLFDQNSDDRNSLDLSEEQTRRSDALKEEKGKQT